MPKNYTAKTDYTDRVPWARVEDFAALELPRPLVLINGCFDILHSGHDKIIAHARDKGATVVCALDSDAKVRSEKGPQRPILTYVERALALNYRPIDFIVEITTSEDFSRLIELLKPDLRVQGWEYRGKTTRFPEVRKMFVGYSGISTTKLIDRIVKRYVTK